MVNSTKTEVTAMTEMTQSENTNYTEENQITEMRSFAYCDSGEKIGFYRKDNKNNTFRKLTNFIIEVEKEVKTEKDRKPVCYFDGKFIFHNNMYEFKNLEAVSFSNPNKLMESIYQHCGTKALVECDAKQLVNAIIEYNPNPREYRSSEFGYDENLQMYVTPDLTIKSDSIESVETPIKNYKMSGSNELGFESVSYEEVKKTNKDLVHKLFEWDAYEVTLLGTAFAFLPLIYPFVEGTGNKKPYMMYRGNSGSGKSMFIQLLQNFYGDFEKPESWSSTDTSLNILSHSFKDALFTIDDLKVANFPSERDVRKAMRFIQNYYDSTARNRANINLDIRDEYYTRGFLAISAEDIVFSEASTLARGIIINMKTKDPNFEAAQELEMMSKRFKSVTPYYIQFLLGNVSKNKVTELYNESREKITEVIQENNPDVSLDNLSRVINNFSLLNVSWNYFVTFLLNASDISKNELESVRDNFDKSLITVCIQNLDRIQNYKPEVKFVNTFWEIVERQIIELQNVGIISGTSKQPVGWYHIQNNKIKMAINLNSVFKEVNRYLITEGGIGVSLDTLKETLIKNKIIDSPTSGRVTVNKKQSRGVYWTGEIPEYLFGIRVEQEEPVISETRDYMEEDPIITASDDFFTSFIN